MSGTDPRSRLIDAVMAVVRISGITGISARSVARAGGFSQALIFYHFDSIDDLLIAASEAGSRERVESWRDRLDAVTSLRDLVDLAEHLHAHEEDHGNVAVLAHFIAGAQDRPLLADATRRALDRWVAELTPVVERLIADSPIAGLVTVDDLAYLIADAFIGIELTGSTRRSEELERRFETLRTIADLIDALNELGTFSTKTIRGWIARRAGEESGGLPSLGD